VPGGASPKKQRRSYSGKKKCHTQKAQVVADQKTKQIIAAAFSAGKTHDFKLFKKSRMAMGPQTRCLADSGYLGLGKCHANSQTPHKKSKHHPLTPEQRAENRRLAREQRAENRRLAREQRAENRRLAREQRAENRRLARERSVAEHIIRSLKIFRILSERYRNRRRRFGLRFNLIAALYNHELCD